MAIKLEIIDSSKGDLFFVRDSITCINLNSYIKTANNIKLREVDKSFITNLNELNLCNFSTLCYKLDINYTTFDCLELLHKIIDMLRLYNSNIKLFPHKVDNYMETDCKPLSSLICMDTNLKVNKILRDSLVLIGFTESQIINLYENFKNVEKLLPDDILQKIPLSSDLSNMTYKCIEELLVD